MSQRSYDRLLAGATLLLACVLAFRAPGVGDYPTDAGPALAAIAHGNLAAFFAHQPAMGSLSLFVRAPFAALSVALHDGLVGTYRWGALPCLLSVAVLAIWLGRIATRRGSGRLAPVLIAVLSLINPIVNDALYFGHPEELLTASLAIGALVAACEGRVTLTAVLTGLAVATKQWALLIVAPSILVLDRQRVRALITAAGVALVATLPMIIANAGSFHHALNYISTPQPVVTIFNWLYPLSPVTSVHLSNIFGDARMIEAHRILGIESTFSRPLITVLGLALPLYLWWRGGRRLRVEELLISTAIVFVLRCALDPGSMPYYHVPILLTLMALDALAGRRLPVAGFAAWGFAFVVLDRIPSYFTGGVANGAYIAASVAACVVLARRLRRDSGARVMSAEPQLGAGQVRAA